MKKEYRKIVSKHSAFLSSRSLEQKTNSNICKHVKKGGTLGSSELIHGISRNYLYDNIFIGTYFEMGVKCSNDPNTIMWLNEKWDYLKKTFQNKFVTSIPVVDISAEIGEKDLFTMLGFACLIAQLSGNHRILLVSSIPFWVDISRCANFYDVVQKIWEICEYRLHSDFKETLEWITEYTDTSEKNVFFLFSNQFNFDWEKLGEQIENKNIRFIFWKMGEGYNSLFENKIPEGFFTEKPFIFMSGYSANVLHNDGFDTETAHSFLYNLCNSSRYNRLTEYFNVFWKELC